jgi:rhodanese-related sulfurtransferase
MQDMVVDALLLDLRDEDEFTQYHLKGGAHP